MIVGAVNDVDQIYTNTFTQLMNALNMRIDHDSQHLAQTMEMGKTGLYTRALPLFLL